MSNNDPVPADTHVPAHVVPVTRSAQACPDPTIEQTLTQATQGLLYLSETDAPFSFVWFPRPQLPAVTEVVDVVLIDASAVEERAFELFFTRLATPSDPDDPVSVTRASRFQVLEKVLRRMYAEIRVYRVQEQANPAVWHIFVLGEDRCGVSGLQTMAVET